MSIAAASTAINLFSFTGRFFYELGRFAVMRGALSSAANIVLICAAYKGKKVAWDIYKDSEFRGRYGETFIEQPLTYVWNMIPEEWRKYIEKALRLLGVFIASGGDVNLAVQEGVVQAVQRQFGYAVEESDLRTIVVAATGGDPLANDIALVVANALCEQSGIPLEMAIAALVPFAQNVLGAEVLQTMAAFAGAAGGVLASFRGSFSPEAFLSPSIAGMLDPQMQKIAEKFGMPQQVVKAGSRIVSVGAAHLLVKVAIVGGGAMVHYAQEEPEKALKIFMAALATTAISAGGYCIYHKHGETIVRWCKDGVHYAQKLTDEQLNAMLKKNNGFKRIAGRCVVGKHPDVEEVFEEEMPKVQEAQEAQEVPGQGLNEVTAEVTAVPKAPKEAPEVKKLKDERPASEPRLVSLYSPMEREYFDPEMGGPNISNLLADAAKQTNKKITRVKCQVEKKYVEIKDNFEQIKERAKEQATMNLLTAVVFLASNMPTSNFVYNRNLLAAVLFLASKNMTISNFACNRYPIGVLSFCANAGLKRLIPMKAGECAESWRNHFAENMPKHEYGDRIDRRDRRDSSLSFYLQTFLSGGVDGMTKTCTKGVNTRGAMGFSKLQAIFKKIPMWEDTNIENLMLTP